MYAFQVFSGASISFGNTDCMQSDTDTPLPSSVLLQAMRRRNGNVVDECTEVHAKLSTDIRCASESVAS